jgi:hypothetical protein
MRASIAADNDQGALVFTNNSFTLECWVKATGVGHSYVLVGKNDINGNNQDYGLILNADGSLLGRATDTQNAVWQARTNRTIVNAADGSWHAVAMVVDRATAFMTIYVDGVAQASAQRPDSNTFGLVNFGNPLRVGMTYAAGSTIFNSPTEFPGIIDEVRVSSSAHTAQQIESSYAGYGGPLINSVTPNIVQVGAGAQLIAIKGYGLNAATVTSDQPNLSINEVLNSINEIDVTITAPSNTPLGTANLTVTDLLGQTATSPITVVNQHPFVNPSATDHSNIILWHLDEPGNGAIRVADSGSVGISGTASTNSLAQPGMFGGGRQSASIAADNPGSFVFSSNSFTLQCWFKAIGVGHSYVLVGKNDINGTNNSQDYGLILNADGTLLGRATDTQNSVWQAKTNRAIVNAADGNWHAVAMVVDRASAVMTIYVDGAAQASAQKPDSNSFGIANFGNPLRVGMTYAPGAIIFGSPTEFPGIIDEVRIVNVALTASQISDYWTGKDLGSPSGSLVLPAGLGLRRDSHAADQATDSWLDIPSTSGEPSSSRKFFAKLRFFGRKKNASDHDSQSKPPYPAPQR